MPKFTAIFLLIGLLLVTGCDRADISTAAPESSGAVAVSEESSQAERFVPEASFEPQPDLKAAEQNVDEFLSAVQTSDRTGIAAYMDYDQLLRLSAQEDADDTNLRTLLRHMQYEIIGTEASGNGAVTTAMIRNADMNSIFQEYLNAAMQMEYDNAGQKSFEEMEEEYALLFEQMLQQAEQLEYSVGIHSQQSGGQWQVSFSEALQTAILGDYYTAQSRSGMNAQ